MVGSQLKVDTTSSTSAMTLTKASQLSNDLVQWSEVIRRISDFEVAVDRSRPDPDCRANRGPSSQDGGAGWQRMPGTRPTVDPVSGGEGGDARPGDATSGTDDEGSDERVGVQKHQETRCTATKRQTSC